MKILALIIFRNEEQYLPGYFRHLRDFVDGFICMDDASTDNSVAIAKAEPKVLKILENKVWGGPHSNQQVHRRNVLIEALAQNADYVLCTDADERYERTFLVRLREIASKNQDELIALPLRDLWNGADQYRVDGIWNTKSKVVFFRTPLNLTYKDTAWDNPHWPWYPASFVGKPLRWLPWNIYHLRSIHREDRVARAQKFIALDPERKQQSIGYDYLADETGLKVEKIPTGREYDN